MTTPNNYIRKQPDKPQPIPAPATVEETFPDLYLSAADLKAGGVTVMIASVYFDWYYDKRDGQWEFKATLTFETLEGKPAKKRLILNKTQTFALVNICATGEYSKMPGHAVQLTPGRQSGKDTIAISHPAATSSAPAPQTYTDRWIAAGKAGEPEDYMSAEERAEWEAKKF